MLKSTGDNFSNYNFSNDNFSNLWNQSRFYHFIYTLDPRPNFFEFTQKLEVGRQSKLVDLSDQGKRFSYENYL